MSKKLYYLASFCKALKKFLHKNSKNSRIDSAHNIIQDGPGPVVKTVKIGRWPDFNDIEKAKASEHKKKRGVIDSKNKTPADKHANHFIDDDPLWVVEVVFLLHIFRQRN